MEKALEILLQYGAIGVILLYFMWKDTKTLDMYRQSIKEIVNEMKMLREDQNNIKKDLEAIKTKID